MRIYDFPMEPTLLLHGLMWRIAEPVIRLTDEIAIGRVKRSEVGRVYRKLCKSRHVDDGEPLEFEVYLSVSREADFRYRQVPPGDPSSLFCALANLLVVINTVPIGYARAIWPGSVHFPGVVTALMWSVAEWTMPLEGDGRWPDVTLETTELLREMWSNVSANHRAARTVSRLETALTYFQHAWRSHRVEQACLHLAVALEVLFAPHAHSETTHQVAFNLAHFTANTPHDREIVYESARDFYAARSAIVHGGTADFRKTVSGAILMFETLASTLRKILTDALLAETFNSDTNRRKLLRGYLFSSAPTG
jgi:hypothetical protein